MLWAKCWLHPVDPIFPNILFFVAEEVNCKISGENLVSNSQGLSETKASS